jgi:hypothetical protein
MATQEAKQQIVVRLAHEAEGPDGEYNWLHEVVKCEVGDKAGTLPKSPGRTARHVKDMKIVGDDILWLLTDRGVGVTILGD